MTNTRTGFVFLGAMLLSLAAMVAGFYQSPWMGTKCPRLQILTIEELLDGQQVAIPPNWEIVPFQKKAPKVRAEKPKQRGLYEEGAG